VATYLNFYGEAMAQSAGPTAWLQTTAAGQALTGVNAPDQLSDQFGGAPTLIGGASDNSFDILDPNTNIVQAPGASVDTVYAWCSFALPANVQNLVIENPGLTGIAGAGGDLLIAQGLNDTLVAGTGDDVLVDGGAGGDLFNFTASSGHDVIYGFQASGATHDIIQLDGTSFTSFGDIQSHLTQVGADTLLTLSPTDAILIRDTTVASLSASDFALPLNLAGITPSFDGEFNSLSLYNPNTGTGTWKTNYAFGTQSGPGDWGSRTLTGNGELEIYVDPAFSGTGSTALGLNPFSVSNGVLTITAAPTPAADVSALSGYDYTSGLITTEKSFAQLYGYFEIRAELPAGQGVWPAFWLLPANGGAPTELDVMEQVGGSTTFQTAHYAGASGAATQTGFTSYTPTDSTGFNTYGVLWTKASLTWYVNGVEVATMATPAGMDTPMYMLVDLAIGGNWPGTPPAGFTSAQLKVDYVRAYSLASLGLGAVAPTTAGVSYAGDGGATLTEDAAHGVLAGDIDNNGQTLTAALAPNGGPSHGTLTLNADGAFTYVADAGYSGSDSFTYIASDSLSSSVATTVTLNAVTGAPVTSTSTTTAASPADNFLGHGVSDLLIENSVGAVVVGEMTAASQISYYQISGLGPEWSFVGSGDFLGDGKTSYLIENTAGAVDVGLVGANGQVSYTQVTALGPEWKFVGSGDFLGDGKSDFLIENAAGAVVVGALGANDQVSFTQVSALGPEWKFVGAGDFLGDGKSDFLIENTAGAVVVGEVGANHQTTYTQVAALGSEWKFVGAGDFLGDGKTDFLIENAAGAVVVGEVGANHQTAYTQIAGLGPEWTFEAVGDYLGEGHDQFVIENISGVVDIGDYTGGQIHFTPATALGPGWLFHH